MTIDSAVNLSLKKPLSILHLEDNLSDAELVRSKLASEKIACDPLRVEHLASFVSALEKGGYAPILADYLQLQIGDRAALKIALEIRPELPSIFLSGAADATDHLLKPDLLRLAPVIRCAAHDQLRTGFEIINGAHV